MVFRLLVFRHPMTDGHQNDGWRIFKSLNDMLRSLLFVPNTMGFLDFEWAMDSTSDAVT